MAHWNHRVVQSKTGDYISFGIHEVFYNDDGSIHAYTEEPISVCNESLKELRETLERMLRCLDKPVLIDGEVEFSDSK